MVPSRSNLKRVGPISFQVKERWSNLPPVWRELVPSRFSLKRIGPISLQITNALNPYVPSVLYMDINELSINHYQQEAHIVANYCVKYSTSLPYLHYCHCVGLYCATLLLMLYISLIDKIIVGQNEYSIAAPYKEMSTRHNNRCLIYIYKSCLNLLLW